MDNDRKHDPPRRRVLVVEDDQGVRELLLELLTTEGHLVRAAANGTQAMTLARELRPDVILLDHRLARADGHDLVGAYHADLRRDGVAVIILSSLTEVHGVGGAYRVLPKPFTLDEVLTAVATAPFSAEDAIGPDTASN